MLIGFAGINVPLPDGAIEKNGAYVWSDAKRAEFSSMFSGKLVARAPMDWVGDVPVDGIVMDIPAGSVSQSTETNEFSEYVESSAEVGNWVLLVPVGPQHTGLPAGALAMIRSFSPENATAVGVTRLGWPVYAEQRWYHKLGLRKTGGMVVAGVGALAALYAISRAL